MTTTLTLKDIGRMCGAGRIEESRVLELLREGLEELAGETLHGVTGDFGSLARVLYDQAEMPIEFIGEGKDTHLVIGNHSSSVVVENYLY